MIETSTSTVQVKVPLFEGKKSIKNFTKIISFYRKILEGRKDVHNEKYYKDFLNNFAKFSDYSFFCCDQQEKGNLINLPKIDYSKDFKNENVVYEAKEFVASCTDLIRDSMEDVHMKKKFGVNEGPLVLIQYWREISSKLGTLWEQIKGDERISYLKELLEYDDKTASTLDIFDSQFQELTKNYGRAKENVKFLETLERHFKTISRCDGKSLLPIVDTLPSMMRALRMVWIISRHFNNEKQMLPLMVLISNDISRKVIEYCDVGKSLENMFLDTKLIIAKFNEGINALQKWKNTYYEVRQQMNETQREIRWDFDTDQLFGRTDYIKARLEDLISLADQILKYRVFLGSNRLRNQSGAELVLKYVKDLIIPFSVFPDIFDSKDLKKWEVVMETFEGSVKEVEISMSDFITKSFEKLSSSRDAFRLLMDVQKNNKEFKNMGDVGILKKKRVQILVRFRNEIEDIKGIFDREKNSPPTSKDIPPTVAKIFWSDSLVQKIKKTVVEMRTGGNDSIFDDSDVGKSVKEQCIRVAREIRDYEKSFYNGWCDEVEKEAMENLKKNILSGDFQKLKNMKVNFDAKLHLLIQETKWLDKLFCEKEGKKWKKIPEIAINVTLQSEKFYEYVEDLKKMISTLETTLKMMGRNERKILHQKVSELVSTIKPGFTVLNWNSLGIRDYITRCNKKIMSFQTIFSKVQKNVDILNNLIRQIKKTNLFIGEKELQNRCLDLSGLYKVTDEYKNHKIMFVKRKFRMITQTLMKIEGELISSNLITKNKNNQSGKAQLLKAYYFYAERKIFRALYVMVMNSLRELKKFRKTPSVIKVTFTLLHNEICEIPHREEIDGMIEKIMNNILNSTKEIARFLDGTCIPISTDNCKLIRKSDKIKEDFGTVIREKFSYYTEIISSKGYTISKAFYQVNQGNQRTLNRIDKLKEFYLRFSQYWKIPKDQGVRKFVEKFPSLQDFEERFEDCYQLISDIEKHSKHSVNIDFVKIDLNPLLSSIQKEARKWVESYGESLYNKTKPSLERVETEINDKRDNLSMRVKNVYDLRSVLSTIEDIRNRYCSMEREYLEIESIYSTLQNYEISCVKKEEIEKSRQLEKKWSDLMKESKTVSKKIISLKKKFRDETIEDIKKLKMRIKDLNRKFHSGPFRNLDPAEMNDVLDELQKVEKERKDYIISENLFDLKVTSYDILNELTKKVDTVSRVYEIHKEFLSNLNTWSKTPFQSIQTDLMLRITKELIKKMRENFSKEETKLKIHSIIKSVISDFHRSIPLFVQLKSEYLRPRHWDDLMKKTGVKIDVKSTDFTLQKLIDMKLYKFDAQLQQIFSDAKKEVNIENLIRQISDGWRSRRFLLIDHVRDGKYRGKIIAGKQEIKEALEEDSTSISGVAGTRHSIPFMEEISKWEKILTSIEETVDLWVETQRSWINLEVIFIGSQDIRQQLKLQAKAFDQIEVEWQKLMQDVSKVKNIKEITNVDGRYDLLKSLYTRLQKCQKGLSNYLRSKRNAFPRFFYLSDEELISILGTNDPKSVQKQMNKMFNNVDKLKFKGFNVIGMISPQKEELTFMNSVSANVVVEKWLSEVEMEMKKSLHYYSKEAVFVYPKTKRINWLFDKLGQIGLVGSQIWWTWEVENSFLKVKEGNKAAVKNLSKKLTLQINDLVEKIRSKLSKQDRKKINTMIIIDVHARDIVDLLVRDSILDKREFLWESQLRFYWDRSVDNIIIKQCNGEFDYGFEYQGLNGRLVITPLTDRCFMTLTTALDQFMGGSPAGPAGTGKTESVKDLAKSMGNLCIVFNCSEGLDYKAMSNIFSGLCLNGAWGCFDEFNRIELPVLSVVSTQIRTIQSALSRKVAVFRFDDQDINLDGKTGIFITMNPGYAGRVELPDNLKALFRPCTMVVPDMEIICEILLFSEGYVEARKLSRKMIKLYKLAKGQLSKQRHYDWGLRALKSVLTKAGELKRDKPDEKENNLLMKALYEMNIAKFIFEDKPLFEDLLKDLFVDVSIDRTANVYLTKTIRDYLSKQGYQLMDNDYQIYKVIQLYETMKSRHATMVVGGSTGGKSVVIDALVSAQSQLGYPTKLFLLNPKAQSINLLYGTLCKDTREWTDGILSNIFRRMNKPPDNFKERRILLFDGDVDTIWIESMNSVMDDNKLLTLPNGERISLLEQCKLLFEVKNLDVASPATVSRCGMVFVDPKNLGQKPYIWRWINDNFKGDTFRTKLLTQLFQKYTSVLIPFVLEGTESEKPLEIVLPLTNVNLGRQQCNILSFMMEKIKTYQEAHVLEAIFIFSLYWSVGGCVRASDRDKFDVKFKKLFTSNRMDAEEVPAGAIPKRRSLYDFFFDLETKSWKLWDVNVSDYVPPENGKFSSILVPTVDTVRYSYFLKNLQEINSPVLFVGIPGTSKTIIIKRFLSEKLKNTKESALDFYFSSRTTSLDVQKALENRIEKKCGDTYAPKANKHLTIFIDELNMPTVDIYGTQQPIAFLKLLIEKNGMYEQPKKDATTINWITIKNVDYCGCFVPPCAGRNEVDPRFVSLFNVFCLTFPSDTSLKHIFNSILSNHLKPFQEEVREVGKLMIEMTLRVYSKILEKLPPTPSKFHYVFNLRDISRVFEGLCQSTIDNFDDVSKFIRLWKNESLRVFHDRLNTPEDKKLVCEEIDDCIKEKFAGKQEEICKIPILLGDFNVEVKKGEDDLRLYADMIDYSSIRTLCEEKLDIYNEDYDKKVDIVLFDFALEHLTRIHRIIRIDRGNALLIGIGGSGKKSLVRLATYLAGYELFQLNMCRNYGEVNFKEDLKELFQVLGVKNKKVVFLFSDADAMEENFFEYINNLLTSGYVPALFPPEERDQINALVSKDAKECGVLPTKENLWNFFLDRVVDNLHVVLAMSPNESLKIRCRNFPGLINNATIDWFDKWPEDALKNVAEKFFVDDTLDPSVDVIVKFMVEVHISVVKNSVQFLEEEKRFNYVTPKNFLDFLSTFRRKLGEKRKEIDDTSNRLKSGIDILEKAEEDVRVMQKQLTETKVIVEHKQVQVKKLLKEIEKNKVEANEQRKDAQKKEKFLKQKTVEITSAKKKSEELLRKAEPILQSAERALRNLKKSDISIIKTFKTPHMHIMEVGNCVVILLNDDVDHPTWSDAQREFGNASFISVLLNFDKNRVTGKKVKRIREIFKRNGKEFNAKDIMDKSVAASGLLQWIEAIINYYDSLTQIKPLRQQLEKAKKELKVSQKQLERTKKKLSSLEELLNQLNNDLRTKSKEAKDLKEKAETMERKLTAAKKLISGLGHEKKRWGEEVLELKQRRILLTGDCLLAAGFLSYLSAFTVDYRKKIVFSIWEELIKNNAIPRTEGKKVIDILSNDVETSKWESEGLPSDEISVQNGILTLQGSKFPLCIDPQLQALKWIRKKEGKELIIRNFNSSDFYKQLENAMKFGKPFLFENVTEFIDPIIEPILNLDATAKQQKVVFGEEEIEVDDDFMLYMTSRLNNPRYSPDIQGNTNVINYSVTFNGLIEQLLNTVVKFERPKLESERKELIQATSKNKSKLKELEEKILRELNLAAKSEQSLVDNEDLIKILDDTKSKAIEIQEKLEIAKQTSEKIKEMREVYRSIAIRGTILFFVMSNLAQINTMYEYSLECFLKDVFIFSLSKSDYSNNLNHRLDNVIKFLTRRVYEYVCSGLFEKDKLTFSMLIALKILQNKGEMDDKELDFFLKGNISLDKISQDNPFSWVSHQGWKDLNLLQNINTVFKDVISDIRRNEDQWKKWYDSEEPEKKYPTNYNDKLTLFQKQCLLRCFRVDRILRSVTSFISVSMKSNFFVRPPILDYKKIFKQSNNMSPIICMISPGYDPANDILQLSDRTNHRCLSISLGQGQGSKAMDLMDKGMQKGFWVLLQNCHLLIDWMVEVEKLLNDVDQEKVNPKFRLWMTSEVTKKFPISILQRSLKIVTEPPNSLKLNMISSYSSLTEEQLEQCPHESFKSLIFVLTYFHAVIQERKKYGKIGFNVPYDFNRSDYIVSFKLFKTYLRKSKMYGDPVPYNSLRYLVGEAMYGGRVTDDFDRRILITYLDEFFGEFLFDTFQPFHFFSNNNIDYKLPEIKEEETWGKKSYMDYTESIIQLENSPTVIGLHPNAEIIYLTNSSKELWKNLILIGKSGGSSSKGVNQDQILLEIIENISNLIPKKFIFDRNQLKKKIGIPDPIQVVLLQEIEIWNKLIVTIRETLYNLTRGLNGEIRMSTDLEQIGSSLFNGLIPEFWGRLAPPTKKYLSDWLTHLQKRHRQYDWWIENNRAPPVMWLSGLHIPESFLTSIVQVTCKRKKWPLDKTVLFSEVTNITDPESITEEPEDGCYVKGLYLEGASWDLKTMLLNDSKPKVLNEELPIIKVTPIEISKLKLQNTFLTPVYYTSERCNRAGEGLVFEANLFSDKHESLWILRGVAITLEFLKDLLSLSEVFTFINFNLILVFPVKPLVKNREDREEFEKKKKQ